MFKLATWNVRGLNAPIKQKEVKDFIHCQGLHFCALLETHICKGGLQDICSRLFGRWSWGSNVAMSETGTRIIITWDASVLDVMFLEVHAQFIHCQILIKGMTTPFFVSVCYGANSVVERRGLWSGLRKFKVLMGAKPWLLSGDFNTMLFPHDGVGGSSRRGVDMADFCMCLEDIDVFDLPYSGIQYTWCQKPAGEDGIIRKLDRAMANTEFTAFFKGASAVFLPRGISDHSPSIISFLGNVRRKNSGFKVENFILEHPKFLDVVANGWKVRHMGSFMFQLTSRLKGLKRPLRRLRSDYGDVAKRAAILKEELQSVQLACDLEPTNVELRDDMAHLLLAYKSAKRDYILMLQQHAKVKWLNEGDGNTRFFHQSLKEKRGRAYIHSVSNMHGVYKHEEEVADAFIEYFRSILGEEDPSVQPSMELYPVAHRLSIQESLHMIRPITDDDIKNAMFSIGNNKAPGSDGFPAKFYKVAWGILGIDVLVAIRNFFYTYRLSKELNHTIIALIPKVPNASSVTEFRPISCCNVLFKCITKIIVNRMKDSLNSLISPSQSAFIQGRKIVDNILMAHELVVGYQRIGGPPRCAFKIDIRKAYDMVSWKYVINMLNAMGFHPALVRWIEELISHPSYSIVINGKPEGFFKGRRGIRQGDPLSPYLFTIVMEGFSRIFRQCMLEANDFGFHYGCEELELTHLCFADDLFVFTRGDVPSVEVLKRALHIFKVKSGLTPSLEKSDIFFGGVDNNTRVAIRECLPFREGTFPIRYLGVPLSPARLSNSDFQPLVIKVRDRIHNWKSKFLSFGGRCQLIISVLQSLQLYWMGVFLLPSGIIHDLESLFRRFLWAQGEQVQGKCRLPWDVVCTSKHHGGLGFRKLSMWNRCILATHLWDILRNRSSLWVRWISLHRIHNASLWSARIDNRWTWIFRRIMSLRDQFRPFFLVDIGDGRNTQAWDDTWLRMGRLEGFISFRLFTAAGFSRSSTVSDVARTLHGAWPNSWIARDSRLVHCIIPELHLNRRDEFCWRNLDDILVPYTVRSAVHSLEGVHVEVGWWRDVWFRSHIPKHSFCMWLACHRRLPTQDRIFAWKHEPPDPKCSLCKTCMDSHDHLFFTCPYSTQVWRGIKEGTSMSLYPDDWQSIVDFISNVAPPRKKLHKLTLVATVYLIWQERNWRLFRDVSRPPKVLTKVIRDVVLKRMAWRKLTKHRIATNGCD